MTAKLSILLKMEPIDRVETNIGILSIFSISVGDQKSLLEKLGASIKECSPQAFIKNFAIFACYPEVNLKDRKYKPDKPVLSLEDIEKLTEVELEDIAKAYVKGNEYLFKKHEFKKKINDKDEEVHFSEYNEIEHPKEDNESYIHYLHRLSCLEGETQKERIKSIVDSLTNLNGFSKSLSSGIAKNLILGESLTKSLEAARNIPRVEISSVSTPSKHIDWGDIERKKEKVRREPFEDLAQRLDQLIDSSIQASEFMIETNRIQTGIATEIKTGGDATDRHAKKNIKLTNVVIALTVVGLLFTAWSNLSGVSFSENQQAVFKSYTSEISDALAMSSNQTVVNNSASREILKEILNSLTQLNKNLTDSRTELKTNRGELEKLKLGNAKHRNEIYILNKKILKLEHK